MVKRLLLFLNLLAGYAAYSQLAQPAAPAIAHLGAYSKNQHNALEAAANQGALGNIKSFAAALYSEKRFLLQELSSFHLAIAQPVINGAFGLQTYYSGNADFNTSKIGFSYGRSLGKTVDAGVQFDYWNRHLRGYGNAAQVTIEAGVLVHISEALHAGFQFCNPVGITFTKQDQKQPAVYTMGMEYLPSQNLILTTEFIKVATAPVAVQAGIEYRFAPMLWTKAGINSSTAQFFISAGFRLKDFSIEVAGLVHPQLGLSPGLMLNYNAMDK